MVKSKFTLFATVKNDKFEKGSETELKRFDEWRANILSWAASKGKDYILKVTYEVYNPETAKLQRFFNGTVVLYYAIQDADILEGKPSSDLLKRYREEMLDGIMGYDYRAVTKTIRQRESTKNIKSVEGWNNLVLRAEEILFEPNGYEMPDSKEFWDLARRIGYEKAKEASILELQKRIKKKYEYKE